MNSPPFTWVFKWNFISNQPNVTWFKLKCQKLLKSLWKLRVNFSICAHFNSISTNFLSTWVNFHWNRESIHSIIMDWFEWKVYFISKKRYIFTRVLEWKLIWIDFQWTCLLSIEWSSSEICRVHLSGSKISWFSNLKDGQKISKVTWLIWISAFSGDFQIKEFWCWFTICTATLKIIILTKYNRMLATHEPKRLKSLVFELF